MHTPRNIQSPYTSTDFWNNFSSITPRMAVFMKVTPALSTGLTAIGLTSNTRDTTLAGHTGITFKSAAGLMPSSFEQAMENPTTLEMTGIFDSLLFDRDDVLAGKWENARVEIFIRSWDTTAVNYGELIIFSGFLGEFRDYQLYFKAEGRGLMSKLSQDAVVVTSRACRVEKFRNSQCGHTAATVVIDGTTYQIVYNNMRMDAFSSAKAKLKLQFPNSNFTTSGYNIPPDGFFNNGFIESTNKANVGISREVSKSYSQTISGTSYQVLVLKRPFPLPVQIGAIPAEKDTFNLTAGCNRTIEDCKKFGNAVNFRGEPFVPGLTAISRVPTTDY